MVQKVLIKAFLICFVIVVVCMGISSMVTMAQEDRFPAKPIKLVIGTGPGGSADLPMRALAKAAENILGQPIMCLNTPGAAGVRALATVLKEKPDGYTLVTLMAGSLSTAHIQKLDFSIVNDFTPIIHIQNHPSTFGVRKDAPWKTWQEIIKYVREHKGVLTVGVWGIGSTDWLVLTQIEKRENVKFSGTK